MKHNSMKVTVAAIALAIPLMALTGCKPAVTQQEKDAVIGLKKLEARIQTGINQQDYVTALGEAVFAVNLIGDNKGAGNQDVDDAIRSALADYKLAGDIWRLKIDTTLNPRDIGVRGAIRVTDPEAQAILNKIPSANKPMTGDLLTQRKKNEYVQAMMTLNVASPNDKVQPLTPKPGDGAVFTGETFADSKQIGDTVTLRKDMKTESVQYLDLEVVTRLLWQRAGESISQAYKLTAN